MPYGKTSLADYIRILVKDGKRSKHPDFQLLFVFYGEEKIRQMARVILKEEKQRDREDVGGKNDFCKT